MSVESLLGMESSGLVSLLGVLSRNPSNASEFALEGCLRLFPLPDVVCVCVVC